MFSALFTALASRDLSSFLTIFANTWTWGP
jgi:hypothetical protein